VERAKAPLSVTSDKEMSKRNEYVEPFTARELPLDGDYDGDTTYTGKALRHGCSNDIRALWTQTAVHVKQFIDREQALTAELLRHKLITRGASNDDNVRRGGNKTKLIAPKKERKKRAANANSASNAHNVHLVGTVLEFLAK
jgi:hypothetical protein